MRLSSELWLLGLVLGWLELSFDMEIIAMKIRLFIKPYCPWCHKAQHWLDERGIKYETLDVIADSKAMTEMVNRSGQRLAPVIDVDGQILADFGPDELAKFWKQFGATDGHR